jgi:sprouty-related, EVH1 domain-containing protein
LTPFVASSLLPDDDNVDPIFNRHPLFAPDSSDSLVKVRAQVMTRDESTEGWLPLQGGGLANVSIRKRARMPDVGGHEYIIFGQRISDQTVTTKAPLR